MGRSFSSPADRRVRRLRLRATNESDARRVSMMFSDALRMASLPLAESGQLLLVRRLPLGRIDPRASAASLSLQIEQAMREVRSQAVPFDSPAAGEANAVVFRSRAQSIARLARLHAGGKVGDWFWETVVPGWANEISRGARWLALLQAAHDLPEAALAAAMVVEEAIGAGVANELFCALPPGSGHDWLQLAGWTGASESGGAIADFALSAPHAAIAQQGVRRWGPTSGRTVWLAVVLAVAEKSGRAGDPRLPARTAAWIAQTMEKVPVELPVEEPISSVAEKVDAEARSEFAGLFFLVPILARLGVADALAEQPALIECDFPWRLLRFIGIRAGLPVDDPLFVRLDFSVPARSLPSRWKMPAAALAELASPEPRELLDSPLRAWLTAVRRWCRRHARMGLVSLIRRPGNVSFSRAHIDVSFALADADIRLRRQALDVDPGWVPWLGQVIRFHYRRDAHD